MSTIKVDKITGRTGSAGASSPLQFNGDTLTLGTINSGVSLASATLTGTTTLTGDLVPSTPLSNRNIIINGGMRVSQRGTSFSPTTTLTHLIDRFRSAHGASFNFDTTITQVATGLNETGQTYCMKVEADSVVSPTGTHNGGILYPVEGQDLQHLQYGGSNAKDMVLSFWAKVSTNAVGTYTVQPRFTDTSGGYHSQYHAISLTTTWTKYEILIPASGSALTYAIKNTNVLGLEILWFLCTGVDDIVSASSTWNDISAYRGVTGQTNFLDSADNEFYLTGVQLELGSNATPFEHRSFGDELRRCQRYYEKSYDYGMAVGTSSENGMIMGSGSSGTATTAYLAGYVHYITTKRIESGTLTIYDQDGTSGKCTVTQRGVSTNSNNPINPSMKSEKGFSLDRSSGDNSSHIKVHFTYDCEL